MGMTHDEILGHVKATRAGDDPTDAAASRDAQSTILLSAGSMAKLRELAGRHGYYIRRGPSYGQGNVSMMMDAIAKGELDVTRNGWRPRLEQHQIQSLEAAGMYNAEIFNVRNGLDYLIRAEAGTPDGLVMMAWWNDGQSLEDLDWFE